MIILTGCPKVESFLAELAIAGYEIGEYGVSDDHTETVFHPTDVLRELCENGVGATFADVTTVKHVLSKLGALPTIKKQISSLEAKKLEERLEIEPVLIYKVVA